MPRGRFITLEGGEGAGKSTQIARLASFLRARKIEVIETREPGGAPAAERIRALLVDGETESWDPLSETLLHYAARNEHLRHTVRPALETGAWVLCDRFADSTMAYQGYGQGVNKESIETLRRIVVDGLVPDLTVILDLPVEDGLRRAEARGDGGMRYERMGIEFHRRLRDGFLDIARTEPARCVVVDATQDIDTVAAAIAAEVSARFPEAS